MHLPESEINQALLKLESEGAILRGHFRTPQQLEWCEQRLLARIHRLPLKGNSLTVQK